MTNFFRFHRHLRIVSLVSFLMAGGLFSTTSKQNHEQEPTNREDIARINSQWDRLFELKRGWTGGDVAGTIDLDDDRVLWVFGDSFVGEVSEGKHAAGSHMINNAIAIQSGRDQIVRQNNVPDQHHFHFGWGPDNQDSKPTAWVVPDADSVQSGKTGDHDSKPGENGWYWPTGGGCTVNIDGKRKLFVFLFHVGSTGEKGVWGFQNIGGAVSVIDNPDEPHKDWQVRQVDLTHTVDSSLVDRTHEDSRFHFETNWGMACVVESIDEAKTTGKAPSESGCVYIYGTRQDTKFNRHLIVARVPAGKLEDMTQWRFYAGNDTWSAEPRQAVSIAEGMVSEFSVEPIHYEGEKRFVMVHSAPMLGTGIFVRTSDSVTGPWSQPTQVYNVPDVNKSKNYFTYAARGHASISPRDQLLITYVVNSNDFWEMVGDASIYRPRCIQLPLSELFNE